ncbi:hypothetical protein FIBSPDRAFT_900558 [Athelia psychrophila]|uniref:Uncharacterized protein n=1 Tax=Athelia psychrophila TaxID=1759441 RepID=A0A165YBR0_9AGAM|nr:hypothetical protein FIBSPDRAFT_900558 [Fibularhizoctonia sp. CBS 109695]
MVSRSKGVATAQVSFHSGRYIDHPTSLLCALVKTFASRVPCSLGDVGLMNVNIRVPLEEDHQQARRGCISVRSPGSFMTFTRKHVGANLTYVILLRDRTRRPQSKPRPLPQLSHPASPICTIFAAPSTLKLTISRCAHEEPARTQGRPGGCVHPQPASRRFTPPDSAGPYHAPCPGTPFRAVCGGEAVVQRDEGAHGDRCDRGNHQGAELVVHIQAGTDAVYNFLFFGGNLLLLGGLSYFHEQVEIGARLMDTKLRGMRASFNEDGLEETDSKARLA